ncbi:DMT family transporter [Agarivorans sp. MS3-6]|uniref:DMT family transporter n=1 Tax=Agarivorans sp. TSD2052 TaxID=2937286 RepID=UPI002010A668|nr:EamA family transporter [Agarivorans sp. TSD2052]UPW19507.1 EamA family transporter [Agarivorans sp. TSD2052]
MKRLTMRGELLLTLATLLAALGWIASKRVISGMPGDVFIASRFLLASAILLPFCYQQLRRLKVKEFAYICGVGLMLAVSMQVWIAAVAVSSSLSEGAFIMSLAMIFAPFTAWLLFKKTPNRAFWRALPLAVIGMMLLTLTNGWQIEQSQWYFLLAAMLLSLHFVLNKKLITRIKPLTSICLQLFVVGVVGAISAFFSSTEPLALSHQVLAWFVVSIVAATAIRYLLQTIGQSAIKMETASLIMILEPIWTLLLSIAILGEQLELQKLIGGGVILLSLIVYIKLSKPRAGALADKQ